MRKYIIISLLGLTLSASAQTLKVCTDAKGRCGYADLQGNIIVSCKYDIAFPFSNGVGKIGKSDKYGLVDASGKVILPTKYEEITLWSGDIFRIRTGKNYGLVSNKGKILVEPKYSHISKLNCYGKAWISDGGSEKKGMLSGAKMGLVNADGKIVIKPEYTKMCEFNSVNGRPDIDGNGISLYDTLKTECKYVSCFEGKKNIVMDEQGNAITPLTDKAVYLQPSSGMCAFAIRDGSKVTSGYWDIAAQKKMLISNKETKFKALICTPFTGNVAKIDNPTTRSFYFIDKTGKKITEEFSRVKHRDGAEGTAGCWIVYSKDKSCALLSDKGYFIFKKGNYQDFKFPDDENVKAVFYPAKQNGRWGLLDGKGNVIIPFEYDEINTPSYDWIWAVKNKKHGIIDIKGNTIIPFDYTNIVKNDTEKPNNIWVCKKDTAFYNFDIRLQRTVGEGMKLATNFINGLAWVVPQNQELEVNMVRLGLQELYNIKVASKLLTSFGILVDTEGNRKSQIPVPQALFSLLSEAIIKNNGNLAYMQEKQLLLEHTRATRIYALSSTISTEEWDY